MKYRRTRLISEVIYSGKDSYPKDTRQKEGGGQTKNITENCEAERKILNHSKEGVIDMLNALTEAFSNVEITEAQEISNEAPAQQNIPITTPFDYCTRSSSR